MNDQANDKSYFAHTRSLAFGMLCVLPMLVLYEVLLVLVEPRVVSGAGTRVWEFVRLTFGRDAVLAFNAVVIIGFATAVIILMRRGGLRLDHWPLMVAESFTYALILGPVVATVLSRTGVTLAGGASAVGPLERVLLALGAGTYEEIIFRLGLLTGFYLLLKRTGLAGPLAAVIAIAMSSLCFAGAHHLVMGAEDWSFYRFAFRCIAGVVFAVLYVFRGLAVAVYTHILYDLLVM